MFKQALSMVLGFLNFTSVPKGADGKAGFTAEQEQKITDEWGSTFLEKLKAGIAAEELAGIDLTVSNPEVTALQTQLSSMKTAFDAAMAAKSALETAKIALEAQVLAMGKTGEDDKTELIDMTNGGVKKIAFKPNMAYQHNKVVADYFRTGTMQYSGDDTIKTSELEAEFGGYVGGAKLEVFKLLSQGLTITDYMTTIVTDKSEWRATKAIYTSVLQQFTPKWTPKGVGTFTPITIKSFNLKVNVPITPSDIIDQYIGYLYDENLTPDAMPIVAFIVNQLVLPKLLEDLEMAMCTGKFVEHIQAADGGAGSAAEDSMDGVLTILRETKAIIGNKGTWLLDGETLTAANIVDKMNEAADSVAYLYKKKKMLIHADPDLILMYQRAYQAKYPNTKNEDNGKLRLDFTNLTFAPVDGLIGSGAFFITPKENFIHLMSRNVADAKIFMQVQNYDVKIFMEFRKGTGFAMQEAIFAHVPDVVTGSGSVGGGI